MDLPSPTEGALAQPTRARIFAFLVEKRAPADTAEIAAHFGLHPNGIRLHLERLEEGGFVVRSRERGGAGRPRDIWTVSPEAHPGGTSPRAYADLAAWLARSIPATEARLREVEKTGREVGADLAPKQGGDAAAALRDALAALGFEPSLERGEAGFSCLLGNCPYRDSVRQNQAIVCGLHRGVTEGILAKLDPKAKLTRFEPGDPDCAGCLVEVVTDG
ncbi:MAG TPA: helix-turn-helix domain-containing protein [Solirubrobacterales bacterium]|nr:helix-turn-helix domain-containing protein [Solirubrobacterales bacterium]